MSAATRYFSEKILNNIFNGGTPYVLPLAHDTSGSCTAWLGLFTSSVGTGALEEGGTGVGNEVSGSGYERVQITTSMFNAAQDTATSTGTQLTNAQQIEFGPASGGNWGTIAYWGLFDAETSGNLIMYGQISPTQTINDGSSLYFPVGDFKITMD